MKTEGEEFQCSDCGAVVPSDSTLCPNCGASLEETSSEEEFVEIPLTSDPSKLSSILSILDEKKIEYSINENAMENVWGPTFSQVPSLLISSNLADEVNEIIDSIEEEEIEVLEKELPDNENQVTDIQREEIKGVEGWLLVLSLLLILGPVAYIPYYIFEFFESQNDLTKYPFTYTIVILDLIVGIYISFLSINAGIKLYKIHSGAVEKAIQFFNLVITYQIISFILIWIMLTIDKIPFEPDMIALFGEIFVETVISIAYAIVAKLYLKNSERVKNTYAKSEGELHL